LLKGNVKTTSNRLELTQNTRVFAPNYNLTVNSVETRVILSVRWKIVDLSAIYDINIWVVKLQWKTQTSMGFIEFAKQNWSFF